MTITPSTEESWVVSLQQLSGRGVKLATILLEADTYGGGNALFVFGALAAAGVETYSVKQGDDLARVLGAGAEPATASGVL